MDFVKNEGSFHHLRSFYQAFKISNLENGKILHNLHDLNQSFAFYSISILHTLRPIPAHTTRWMSPHPVLRLQDVRTSCLVLLHASVLLLLEC